MGLIKAILKRNWVQKLVWTLLLLSLWQVLYLLELWSPSIFPSMVDIMEALWWELLEGDLFIQIYYSLRIIFIGMVIATLLGIIMAYLNSQSRVFNSLFDTLTVIAHPLPGIALMPLVILWVGTGEDAALFIIIHSVLWPLAINMTTGFKATKSIYADIGKNYELRGLERFLHILLPASGVYFLAGLRISWSRAWRALISAEMIFGAMNMMGGIGWYYFEKRVFMDTAGMYAGLIAIILVGFLVENTFFMCIEKKTIVKWGMKNEIIH